MYECHLTVFAHDIRMEVLGMRKGILTLSFLVLICLISAPQKNIVEAQEIGNLIQINDWFDFDEIFFEPLPPQHQQYAIITVNSNVSGIIATFIPVAGTNPIFLSDNSIRFQLGDRINLSFGHLIDVWDYKFDAGYIFLG